MNARPLRRYFFHVRRATDPFGPMQPLEVIAYDSHEAIRALPDDVISWDWRQEDGVYSMPIHDERAAA